MRGGGLGGAASGASDIVDGANPVMHCGTAASKPNVKNKHSHGVFPFKGKCQYSLQGLLCCFFRLVRRQTPIT